MIDRFTEKTFRKFMDGLGPNYKTMWQYGELVFLIPVFHSGVQLTTNKRIVIRSSVYQDGHAAKSGANSIRIWMQYFDRRSQKWRPLGKDKKKLTQRTHGWQGRVKERLKVQWKMALDDERRHNGYFRKAVERYEAERHHDH